MADATRPRPFTVLIHEYATGGGFEELTPASEWAAQGSSMRRALAEDFSDLPNVSVVMMLDARLPDEPGPWSITRVRGVAEELETLARLSAKVDGVLLIAPETDGLLLERARLVQQSGGCSLGCTPEAIALTGNKLALSRFYERKRLDVPRSEPFDSQAGLPARFKFPVVIKPIDGAGAFETRLVRSRETFPSEEIAGSNMLIQEYYPGVPMSASLLLGPGKPPLLVGVGRQHVALRDDRFYYEGGRLTAEYSRFDPVLHECVRAVEGLRGFVGIDFIVSSDRSIFMEINPRATAPLRALRRALGPGKLAEAWLSMLGLREGHDSAAFPARIPISFNLLGDLDEAAD